MNYDKSWESNYKSAASFTFSNAFQKVPSVENKLFMKRKAGENINLHFNLGILMNENGI